MTRLADRAADLKRENAELRGQLAERMTELREALAQQAATAEVLQVINSSPGDLAPVFDAMLEKAIRLCEAAAGILWIYDGGRFRAIAHRGLPDKLIAELHANPIPTAPLQKIAAGANIVRDDDLRKNLGAERVVAEGGMRTGFLVALRKGDTLRGAIRIHRREARPVHRQASCAGTELPRASGHRHRERPTALRIAAAHRRSRRIEPRLGGASAEQVEELGRVGRLKRFLAPQLAELIVSQGDEKILESHRREIVVVFCDLRGFTGFAERAEPEELMTLLRDYHAAMGPIVAKFEGTIDH